MTLSNPEDRYLEIVSFSFSLSPVPIELRPEGPFSICDTRFYQRKVFEIVFKTNVQFIFLKKHTHSSHAIAVNSSIRIRTSLIHKKFMDNNLKVKT